MKHGFLFSGMTVLLCLLLPWLVIGRGGGEQAQVRETETEVTEAVETAAAQTESPSERRSFDMQTEVSVLFQGIPVQMTLHDYLIGVLLGELPAGFSAEAFAAQAVACRTYTLKVMAGDRHRGGVCTDHRCCQAWREPGGEAADVVEKAEQAVAATDGLVLTYRGKLIDATYFSCSGGRTEDAAAVWGGEVPYLRSVDSPGEEFAPRFTGTVTFLPEELRQILTAEDPNCDLSGSPETWFGPAVTTEGGGVASQTIGGTVFTGKRLRTLLGLNSTVFTVAAAENEIVFSTRGFGHRVGMSQYGAEAMARAGKTAAEILAHYYPGTELVPME